MTKQDIKRLLTKGLTGREAAKLIIADCVEVDHGREGLLSSADIQIIRNSLTNPADIQDYNNWIKAYQLISFTIKEAVISILEAERDLLWAIFTLQVYCTVIRMSRTLAIDKDAGQKPSLTKYMKVIHRIHRSASEHIKLFLAVRAVMEAISQAIGVKLTEDLDQRLGDIRNTVNLYNDLLNEADTELGLPKIESRRLKIGILKPTASAVKYYVERMSMAFGEDWWPVHAIELFGGLNFLEEVEEADSLAGEIAQEFKQKLKELEERGMSE